MQGIKDNDEKLKALKYHQLDAGIARLQGDLAPVPQPYYATMENAITQMQLDLADFSAQNRKG